MNPVRLLSEMGVSISLVEGQVKLSGLDRLDRETASRALTLARAHKPDILAELEARGPITPALAELDRFFAVAVPHVFPDGAEGWIDPTFKTTMGDDPYE